MLRALAVSLLVIVGLTYGCSGGSKPTFLETCDKLCDKEAACDPSFVSRLTACKSACAIGNGTDNCFAGGASDAYIAAVNACLGGSCSALMGCVEAMCNSTGGGGSGSGPAGAGDGAAGSTGASGADGGDAAKANSTS
jgi:hypothetical protein